MGCAGEAVQPQPAATLAVQQLTNHLLALRAGQVAAGMPWTYAGVRHPPARFGLQTAEAAAAAAATGQPLTYRARTKTKREARGHVSNLISTHQAVAARANDIWAGNNTNFTDAEWQQVGTCAAVNSS